MRSKTPEPWNTPAAGWRVCRRGFHRHFTLGVYVSRVRDGGWEYGRMTDDGPVAHDIAYRPINRAKILAEGLAA